MEKSRRDLESLVNAQKEQLSRYETRLKDVVTAYKGLLKEKEALDASLAALTKSKENINDDVDINNKNISMTKTSSPSSSLSVKTENVDKIKPVAINNDTSQNDNIQLQISTLMNSLATLSAEKSRMEASFQGDKKQLRSDILQKDKIISDLKEKIVDLQKQNSNDLENMKSKLIVERHEREKESNNHMVMIRELQKLFSDERHIKENLEMQLNDLKNQYSRVSNNNNNNNSSETSKIRELMNELKETKDKLRQYETVKENQNEENSTILLQLQNEMQHLKQQHAIALKTEQKRALMAEERNKKLAALHEDRVANLEARLAELSNSVGTYDRLRQQDQDNIQKLKEKIIRLASASSNNEEKQNNNNDGNNEKKKDIEKIIEEIMQLKKSLLIENARSDNPVDINKIFNISSDHSNCIEDYNKIQNEFELIKVENIDLKQALEVQKNHIKTLQEKVKVLNRNIDEQELELKTQSDRLSHAVKAEKSKWKDAMNRLENEYRCKLNNLELQLQKQRIRSLQLLDEKENEIKALKTSFEIFSQQPTLPSTSTSQMVTSIEKQQQDNEHEIGSNKKHSITLNSGAGNLMSSTINEHSPMLHYVNELARKDVEITALRKSKYIAEKTLREALQDKVASQEELNDKILRLEEQVDRLERCKTREGANLEYLKNVIISFLSTNNVEGKKHMVNAIGAVLQFTPSEMKSINNLFPRK